MVNKLYQFTTAFFILFTGFSASVQGKFRYIDHKYSQKTSFSKTNHNQHPLNYDYNLNNVPYQVINVQQHRGAHSIHGFYYIPSFYSIGIKYLNFICGGGTSELSRFRKLILFPFHAFW